MVAAVTYAHTQRASRVLSLVAVGVIGLALGAALFGPDAGSSVGVVPVAVLAIGIVVAFGRLTVTVDGSRVRAAFGLGWPSRSVPLGDIVDASVVRNRWFYGWGIRKIPKGWMFNVRGLDAVELQLTSGRVFRIGTDQPNELAAAINTNR